MTNNEFDLITSRLESLESECFLNRRRLLRYRLSLLLVAIGASFCIGLLGADSPQSGEIKAREIRLEGENGFLTILKDGDIRIIGPDLKPKVVIGPNSINLLD